MHPFIVDGLPQNMREQHLKMFGDKKSPGKNVIGDMTEEPIQGFPRDKKDQEIEDILKEIAA